MSTADLTKAVGKESTHDTDLLSGRGEFAQQAGRPSSRAFSLYGASRRWLLLGRSWRNSLLIFGVVGLLYCLAGHFALYVTSEQDGIAMFWPSSGIAAGAMAALGAKYRWPILSAVVVGTVVANLQSRSGFALIAAFAVCNALECLLFGFVLRALDRSRSQLESLGGVVAFFAAAGIGAIVPAVFAAVAIEHLTVAATPWTQTWFTWFKSDLLGIVVLAPLIITFPAFMSAPPRPRVVVEGAVALIVAVATTYYAFSRTFSGIASYPPPAMLLFPTFVWLAARSTPFFAALTAFLISVVIVVLALTGEGRFADGSLSVAARLGIAQSSFLTGCAALLTLSAMVTRINNVATALQSSEQRLKLALGVASMYAFDFDVQRSIVQRTGGLMPRLGLPEIGEASGYIDILHPDDRDGFVKAMAAISPAEPQLKMLVRMLATDGRELAIEYRSEGVFDDDGRLVRLHGICVDVTDREQSRELVEKQAAQLSGALNAGRVFAYDYDYATKSITRSANAVDILGIPRELLNDPRNLFKEMVHPDDRDALIAYGQRKAHDDGFRMQTFRFIRPDGRVSWLEVTSTAVLDETGKLKAVRGLARDVSAQTLSDQRQSMLIEELDHRVKNGLTRMKVVLNVSRDRHQSLDDYVAVIQGRIDSMARTQERLSRSKWDGAYLEALVDDELAAYRTPTNCRVDGPSWLLDPIAAQGFAFTLHELATNAAKHGALSRAEGRVEVVWRIEGEGSGPRALRLIWREIVDGGVVRPQKESYGLRTIRSLLEHEQDATVSLDFTPNGLVCEIEMSLKAQTGEPLPQNSEENSEENSEKEI